MTTSINFKTDRDERLDHALRRQMALSVKEAKRVIKGGHLRVNGYLVKKPAFSVRPGDQVEGTILSLEKKSEPEPELVSLEILYEDESMLIINKLPGLLSVPLPGRGEASVLDHVQDYLSQKEPVRRAFAVHRLDRGASGTLIFAKGAAIRDVLMEDFKAHRIQKIYWVLCQGLTDDIQPCGEINLEIDDNRPKEKSLVGQGKPAKSLYQVLAHKGDYGLVQVETLTGRRHQVRLHLSSQLAPIYADSLYGQPLDAALESHCSRLALHAHSIALKHPRSGESLIIEAPLTKDLSNLLNHLDLFFEA